MCANPLCVRADLDMLINPAVAWFHCDVMDGHFVPNLMLSAELIGAVKAAYAVPLDIHLMVEKPEAMLGWFPIGPGDMVSIHYESTPHVPRALEMIRERGAKPALALNPATPLECCRELLADIDALLLMTVNPGYAGQRMVKNALDKIARARAMLDERGYRHMPIEVDGNCSLQNIPLMEAAGANIFVAGSSSLFSAEHGIERGLADTIGRLRNIDV
jgi:ribulose-phosphate 3-epimerase